MVIEDTGDAGPPTRAGDLAPHVAPLPANASCERARDAFDADPSLFAVAIVDGESRPIGLINRFKFLERLASRFGRELVLKKPVSLLMESDPLILDEGTHIDELGNRLLSEQNRYVFDGFIVTRDGCYAGLGTGLDLIRALTERRHAELQQMALHDMLTGLPNRALFEQRLAAALGSAGTASVAVLFVDLDRFKEINDTHGHRFGDLVLCGVSQRMRGAVRRSDLVARLSGDEFAVVIPDIQNAEDADAIARVLLGSCGAPLTIDGREVVVSCSIGVAIYPQHGETQEALLRAADTAQYHAKEVRNSWQRYSPEMQEWRSATPGLGALRQALESGRLAVHYQPVIDIRSRRIGSVEALVRWRHEDHDVPAADIVSLAEESGLIVPLTEFVLRTALLQMREWDDTIGRTDLRLAVNISAVQVAEGGLVAMAARCLAFARDHPDPGRLRHRLLGAQPARAPADRCGQNRQELSRGGRGRRERRHRQGHHRHGPRTRHDGGRRRRGNRGAVGVPSARGRRLRAGLSPGPADGRRRAQRPPVGSATGLNQVTIPIRRIAAKVIARSHWRRVRISA